MRKLRTSLVEMEVLSSDIAVCCLRAEGAPHCSCDRRVGPFSRTAACWSPGQFPGRLQRSLRDSFFELATRTEISCESTSNTKGDAGLASSSLLKEKKRHQQRLIEDDDVICLQETHGENEFLQA